MPILKLPTQLANQIAAGEVVERPASVVKELVENSIDAGATDIHIEIERGGHRRIRIRDNGQGIPKDELELALSRHATSKIASLDDLEAILSLGFRGEALASISSVSRLSLTSKTADQESAWRAFCEGRDMQVTIEPASHPTGTTLDVEDLFFNTPARRKFLRTEKTEFGHIDEVVKRIALARPDIGFKLSHNGQVSKHYPQQRKTDHQENGFEARISKVLTSRFTNEAVKLDSELGSLRLRGWISPPTACRHQQDIQYFFVNGRMMRDRLLNHAVRQAYGDSLPEDRHASFVLYLELPAQDVDVNVHPAKHEVRFHQARQVHDFVLSAVRAVLLKASDAEVQEAMAARTSHEYQPPDLSRYVQDNPFTSDASKVKQRGQGYSSGQLKPASQAVSTWNQMRSFAAESAAKVGGEGEEDWQPIYSFGDALLCAKGQQLGVVATQAVTQSATLIQLREQLQTGLAGQPLLLPTQFDFQGIATCVSEYRRHLSLLGVEVRITSSESPPPLLTVPATPFDKPAQFHKHLPLTLCLQLQASNLPMQNCVAKRRCVNVSWRNRRRQCR